MAAREYRRSVFDLFVTRGVVESLSVNQNYIESDSCWLWQGTLNDQGYGTFSGGLVHRYMYQQKYGTLDDSNPLHHDCRVKRCINPDHTIPLGSQIHHIRLHMMEDKKWLS